LIGLIILERETRLELARMIDLNSLIPSGAAKKCRLYNGLSINDNGEIVVWAAVSPNNENVTLILTPMK
jgi:hypothetical protein